VVYIVLWLLIARFAPAQLGSSTCPQCTCDTRKLSPKPIPDASAEEEHCIVDEVRRAADTGAFISRTGNDSRTSDKSEEASWAGHRRLDAAVAMADNSPRR
jgi:hypothetical protein